MTAVTKIVFLGASSASFGISMFRDLFSGHDLAGSTLILVGRNVDRLARTERLAKLLNEKSGGGIEDREHHRLAVCLRRGGVCHQCDGH